MSKVTIVKNDITLPSGVKLYANNGIMGIVRNKGDIELYGGYDGPLLRYEKELSDEDRKALAEHVIEIWREWGGLK